MSKKQEKVSKRISDTEEPKSRAKRIRMLLKKNEAVFRDKQKITDFKEPILFMIRRGRAVEFYEDASKGSFTYKHSDGNTREIYLEPSKQLSFDYGKRKFKGYICYEDTPLPLPEEPIVTAGTINDIVEKVGLDMKKLGLREAEMRMKFIKTLLLVGVVAAGIYFAWKADLVNRIVEMLTGKPRITENMGVTPTESVNNDNMLQITGNLIGIAWLNLKEGGKAWKRHLLR